MLLLLSIAAIAVFNDVIYVQGDEMDEGYASCPKNCTCTMMIESQDLLLKIECKNRTSNSSTLATEIDQYLFGKETNLTDLTITLTPLTSVPRSVCSLLRLQGLHLNNNSLTTLPEHCFNNMTELRTFDAIGNRLVELQEGVFDGLRRLTTILLTANKISKIGLHVFTKDAGLDSLAKIYLDVNNLTELEPWPMIRGQMISSEISFEYNQITNFTNQLHWSFRCIDKIPFLELKLRDNKIKHLTDFTNGWNISGRMIDVLCLFGDEARKKLRLGFKTQAFICDCIDFEFYKLSHAIKHSALLDVVFCNEPSELHDQRIPIIPLDRFVCDIPSPPCPEDCQCIKRPSNRTYIVKCRNVNTLPPKLPDPDQPPPSSAAYQYMLDFSNSRDSISTVEYRDYFNITASLSVKGSSVGIVADDAWRAFHKFKFRSVDLSFNQLTVLPLILQTENLTFQPPQQLALEGNPFLCSCEDRWMRGWLLSLGDALTNPDSVTCTNPSSTNAVRGKSILKVTDDEFCYDPVLEKITTSLKIALPTVLSFLLATAGISLLYRYRFKAFMRFNVHPFDVDECRDETMHYDVFVSCAHEDSDVARNIVDSLERGYWDWEESEDPSNPEENDRLIRRRTQYNNGYKVCYHERDFMPGEQILTNITSSVVCSKRVICLVSNSFLRSSFCMAEFEFAWTHNLTINKRRLIVVKLCALEDNSDPLPPLHQETTAGEVKMTDFGTASAAAATDEINLNNATRDLRMFLKTHTYIEYRSENWWQKLLYAMPQQSMNSTQQ